MTEQSPSAVHAPYPFSAVVGADQLRLALVLCAVRPSIGGVLVRGEKGTAKSTIVRGLASLLPAVTDDGEPRPARLVELPIGATEDRVVGSLDLEKVLRDGERAFSPGLLHAAHRGVLYVDEVNLLHDHLVDVLLDAAAMGRVHIERDGVSHSHEARFVLVGTMNPEEGELRPQLLDRFGLAVDVAASREVTTRAEVIRRRLAYEADPSTFAERFAAEEQELATRIRAASEAAHAVRLPDEQIERIAAVCASFDVEGMRADIVVARTAVAHAAWSGRSEVITEDVRVAAELALPHRRRRDPFDEPGLDHDQLDEALKDSEPPEEPEDPQPEDPQPDDPDTQNPGPDPDTDPDSPPPSGGGKAPERPAGPVGATFAPRALRVDGVGEGEPGRRSRALSRVGAVIGSQQPGSGHANSGLHLMGTLFAAAARGTRATAGGALSLIGADLRHPVKEGREGNLIVFVVDASGSMAARDRLAAVTGAATSLLRDAYQRRDKVAVVTMRGDSAELALPPTGSVEIAARRLAGLLTGGKTPLAEGLLTARDVVRREKLRDPQRRALIVVLTDGRATGGPEPLPRAHRAAALLHREGHASVVIDCESGWVKLGLARSLAVALGGGYLGLGELDASALAGAVRAVA